MFLHYILTREANDLIYRFFTAQHRNPSKGDWSEMVKEDLKDFNITETFEEISSHNENTLKRKVMKAAKDYNFKLLMIQTNKHSKGSNISYR